jgi:uncharacterized protein (TIGR00255 family)
MAVPGLFGSPMLGANDNNVEQLFLEALQEAVIDLKQAKKSEGQQLANFLAQMLKGCTNVLRAIEIRSQASLKERFSNLKNRLNELVSDIKVDEERIYQEIALLAERSDFKEELDRLSAHIKHFDTICRLREQKGRKLDFLCQEMLRESNTLLSKALDPEVTRLGIDLKAEVERMREQVQNIE